MSFQTEYLVSMTCQSCVDSISNILKGIRGIDRYEIDLGRKTVTVSGSASPADTVQRLQEAGRTTIVKGLGSPDGAAVCILEKTDPESAAMNVYGLARFVELSPGMTVCDLTLKGLPQGEYEANIHTYGDVRNGMHTAGPIWERGQMGKLNVDKTGTGQCFLEKQNIRMWEVIGRALVVRMRDQTSISVAGVIARSAGVWENTKSVCTCSGQNVWDERQEMLQIGSTL